MMSRLLVSVPVWGDAYVEVFAATALPALERAMLQLPSTVQPVLVCHTSSARRIRSAATLIDMEFRPVPAGMRDWDCMSQAHREVIDMAMVDDYVCLLTADLVISELGLLAALTALVQHPIRKLVLVATIRAQRQEQLPDTGNAEELMRWAWAHRHEITYQCIYPNGTLSDLSRLFFTSGEGVITRQCLLHPLVLKKDSRIVAFHPTIDVNLANCYDPEEVYVFTTTEELALIELSPLNKLSALAPTTIRERVVENEVKLSDPMQKHMIQHRIVLVPGIREDEETDEFVVGRMTGKKATQEPGT